MSFGDRLVHALIIERPVTQIDMGDEVLDDYGQPVRDYDEIASVKGLVQPKNARELALLSNAGAPLSDHTIYLFPTELTTQDRIKFADDHDPRRYEIVGIRDAAGIGHHLEVDAKLVAAEALVTS